MTSFNGAGLNGLRSKFGGESKHSRAFSLSQLPGLDTPPLTSSQPSSICPSPRSPAPTTNMTSPRLRKKRDDDLDEAELAEIEAFCARPYVPLSNLPTPPLATAQSQTGSYFQLPEEAMEPEPWFDPSSNVPHLTREVKHPMYLQISSPAAATATAEISETHDPDVIFDRSTTPPATPYHGLALLLLHTLPPFLATHASLSSIQSFLTRSHFTPSVLSLACILLRALPPSFFLSFHEFCPSLTSHTTTTLSGLSPASATFYANSRPGSTSPDLIILTVLLMAQYYLEDTPNCMKWFVKRVGEGRWTVGQVSWLMGRAMEGLGWNVMALAKEERLKEVEEMARSWEEKERAAREWLRNERLGVQSRSP